MCGPSSPIDLLCRADKNWTNTHPYTQYGPSYHTTLLSHAWGTTTLRFEIHLPRPHQPTTTNKAASINYKSSKNDNNYSHPLGKSFTILLVEHCILVHIQVACATCGRTTTCDLSLSAGFYCHYGVICRRITQASSQQHGRGFEGPRASKWRTRTNHR